MSKDSQELLVALSILEKERNISKDTMIEAIEKALISAYTNHFKLDNCKVEIDKDTCEYKVYSVRTVVDEVYDPVLEILPEDALNYDADAKMGDEILVPVESKEFGRIATMNAKNQILQKIREEERSVIFNEFHDKERKLVTGVVQRFIGKNISINLGKADAILTEKEQVRGERYRLSDRIKVFVVDVKDNKRGPRILVSRSHPDLVRCLFESEVAEVADGIVEIMGIAREAGSRSKIAVYSQDPDVDPVGACVGMNGARVNAIVDELQGEKIDIINWDDNPAFLIENALSPAKVIFVMADPDEKMAKVVVPDYQLSLAIGKEGQNARLAARLTGYKIDIKSETQAREAGEMPDEYTGEYDEEFGGEYFTEEDFMMTADDIPEEDLLDEGAVAEEGMLSPEDFEEDDYLDPENLPEEILNEPDQSE